MASLNQALDVQKQLFDRYDRLNDLWDQAEKQLVSLHVPRAVRYVFHSYQMDDKFPTHFCHCLGLQKVQGNWRICYGTDYEYCQYEHTIRWTPIAECSAEIRVKAASHLPGLRSAALASSETFLPEVEKAIEELAKGIATGGDNAERFKMNGQPK